MQVLLPADTAAARHQNGCRCVCCPGDAHIHAKLSQASASQPVNATTAGPGLSCAAASTRAPTLTHNVTQGSTLEQEVGGSDPRVLPAWCPSLEHGAGVVLVKRQLELVPQVTELAGLQLRVTSFIGWAPSTPHALRDVVSRFAACADSWALSPGHGSLPCATWCCQLSTRLGNGTKVIVQHRLAQTHGSCAW